MNQYEVVRLALEQNGGHAKLVDLYNLVIGMPEWKSTSLTPQASIRQIVQLHPDLFFRIHPGLWGLQAQKEAIGKQLALPEYAPPPKAEQYNHTYYQGLLVEIGNWKKFKTVVPVQDKNRQFLGGKLSEVTSLPTPYNFTFSGIMGKAKTIDVSWYNERHFPQAFYEVEHSTNFINSLHKFVEFQDFRVKLYVVADQSRRAEFESKRKAAAFSSIASSIKFLSYEELRGWHGSAAKLASHEKMLLE